MDKNLEETLLKTTSIIYAYKNEKLQRMATCFFCMNRENKCFLVTNKHVLEQATHAVLLLTIDGKFENIKITFSNNILEHPLYDLCILDFTNFYNILSISRNIKIGFINYTGIVSDFNQFGHIEDIIMVGYPDAIINKCENMPLIRKGVTATSLSHLYDDNEMFLTDIPTVGGSSGSPIFIIKDNVPYLVGINFRNYVDTTPVFQPGNRLYHHKKRVIGYVNIPNGLGIAIKSSVLQRLINNLA